MTTKFADHYTKIVVIVFVSWLVLLTTYVIA